jgi:hypothetical protein
MRYIFTILSVILLSSCGSYRIQVREPQISNVLAITTEGDTIQVPIQALQRNLTSDYYSGYRFYWNNSWWMYNDWYWNYYYQNPRLFYPRYQLRVPRNRVRIQTPRYTPQRRVQVPRQPQRRTPQVQPNRGRSNQTIRKPQYNRPRTTTRPSTSTRRPVPTRSNSNTRSRNGNQ